MNKFFSKFALAGLLCSALAMPSLANAEGFALQDWSARGAALAGGLVARGGDASAVAYNPAAITELDGLQIMVGSEFVIPFLTIEGTANNVPFSQDGSDQFFIIPHGYATYKLNDKISLGLGAFSRFGLGNDYPNNWVGSDNVTYVNLLTSTINPNIAWRVNDMVSLAAGLEISGAQVKLHQSISDVQHPALGTLTGGRSRLESDIAYALGFNLAAHLRFNEQWSAGLTYRSAINYHFDGEQKVNGSLLGINGTYQGTTTLHLPQEVKAAVAYAPNEKISFEAGIAYYGWSAYDHLNLYYGAAGGPGGISVKPNEKDWNDTWMYSFSTEYAFYEWLDLRAGVSYETAAVNEAHADYMVPAYGRWKFGVGAGVHKDAWAIDAAYVYHMVNGVDYAHADAVNDHIHNDTKSTNVGAHAFNLSFSYKF